MSLTHSGGLIWSWTDNSLFVTILVVFFLYHSLDYNLCNLFMSYLVVALLPGEPVQHSWCVCMALKRLSQLCAPLPLQLPLDSRVPAVQQYLGNCDHYWWVRNIQTVTGKPTYIQPLHTIYLLSLCAVVTDCGLLFNPEWRKQLSLEYSPKVYDHAVYHKPTIPLSTDTHNLCTLNHCNTPQHTTVVQES